jgi:hypothetical protein
MNPFKKPPKKSKDEVVHHFTPAERRRLEEIEADAIANFEGPLDELESAIGMLRMGHHWGWKVLYIIHSKRTIRKYEGYLGIKIRELFDETGPSSYRSNGYRFVETFTNFWKAISGELKIDDRKKVDKVT